ncbi:hypothetical protein [Conexibacter sp. DBS9H8]|uniref:hypothetical protein n=1 Tax=Conexibacter sp. DBS9H8 TaxID=2937801 RepID=UPI00200F7C38|nr:hypothetical protein [Conexibacter sp. DBS9H8]
MRLEIEIETVDPPCGWVRSSGGPPIPFAGRVRLLAAIERLCAQPEPAADR